MKADGDIYSEKINGKEYLYDSQRTLQDISEGQL